MILLIIVCIAVIVGTALIDNKNSSKTANEYCSLECKERKFKKYKFCC